MATGTGIPKETVKKLWVSRHYSLKVIAYSILSQVLQFSFLYHGDRHSLAQVSGAVVRAAAKPSLISDSIISSKPDNLQYIFNKAPQIAIYL